MPHPHDRRSSRPTAALVTAHLGSMLLGGILAGCGQEAPAPSWIPIVGPPDAAAADADLAAGSVRLVRRAVETDAGPRMGIWIESVLPRPAWHATPWSGCWQTARPAQAASILGTSESNPSLGSETGDFAFIPQETALTELDPRNLPPGHFAVLGNSLFLMTEPGEPPPERAIFAEARGEDSGGPLRLLIGDIVADGIPVWSGSPTRRTVAIPPASALRFATVTATPEIAGGTLEGQTGTCRFEVTLDGRTVFEHEQRFGPSTLVRWHAVPLPPGGSAQAELVFSVEGPVQLAAFLCPELTPADIGRPGARLWDDERPDIVLFLADTFRFDLLTSYGGTEHTTPSLDAFVEESVRFARAWTPASWTLPAHASLLSGLQPFQHGATKHAAGLSQDVVTVAEALRRAGYRTGAVTDSGFVSHYYGLDQGFEWFDERKEKFGNEKTDAVQEFLDGDDGRPFFLFVHTYRVHSPYRVSDETKAAYGDRLDLEPTYKSLAEELVEIKTNLEPDNPVPDELREWVLRARELYLGSSVDLDRDFGRTLDVLDERGIAPGCYVLFTSDHGDAFLEHDELGHGIRGWDEVSRVPLVIRGPGLTPGTSAIAATLVDLPPTIAEMADAPIDPGWGGRSLLSLDEDRTIYSFACIQDEEKRLVFLVDGDVKLFAEADGSEPRVRGVEHAFDLRRDPGEANDLSAAGERAQDMQRLLEGNAGAIGELLVPRFDFGRVNLTKSQVQLLEALGYVEGVPTPDD